MDLFAFPPLALALDLTYGLLIGLTTALTPTFGTASTAAVIVVVTVAVRTMLLPAGIAQARAAQVRARLAPRVREIRQRFRKRPERMQRELIELYRNEQASPLAGMLPMLVQAPLVGLIYTVFLRTDIAGHANALLAEEFLGVPLGAHLLGAAGAADPATLAVFGSIIVVLAAVAEVTRRVFRQTGIATADAADPSPLASAGAQRVLGFAPYLTVIFVVFLPLAAALYLVVTMVWTLGQRWMLTRRYPLR